MAIISVVTSLEDIKVQIVTAFPDVCIFETHNKWEAAHSDIVWFFDNALSAKKIRIVSSFPDLKIQYVDSKTLAGWKNKTHRLRNKLG